jgi:hypothetical protein
MFSSHLPIFAVNHDGAHALDRSAAIIARKIDVWMYVNLSERELFYNVRIAEFLGQRLMLEAEYWEGMRRNASQ